MQQQQYHARNSNSSNITHAITAVSHMQISLMQCHHAITLMQVMHMQITHAINTHANAISHQNQWAAWLIVLTKFKLL